MSHLDAFFGRLKSNGVQLPLRGALNFVGFPVTAEEGGWAIGAPEGTGAASTNAIVRTVATVPVTLAGEQTINDIELAAGDVVLTLGQTQAYDRAPWVVQTGGWTRPAWFATSEDAVSGMVLASVGDRAQYMLVTTGPISLGVSGLSWKRIGGQPFIDVTQPPYSLKGDGSDDSPAFTRLFDALPALSAAGGATIYWPPGNYQFKDLTLVLPQFIDMIGAGYGSIIQRRVESSTGDVIRMNSWLNAGGSGFQRITGLQLRNMPCTVANPKWGPNKAFSLNQIVLPQTIGAMWALKCVQAGTTGAFRPIGELSPTYGAGKGSKLVGTASGALNLTLKVTTPGWLGTMAFQMSFDGGATYAPTIYTTPFDTHHATMAIPGHPSLFVRIPNSGYDLNDVITPQPRVEVLGTPPADDYVVDVITTVGPLGTVQFYEGHGVVSQANINKFGLAVTAGAVQNTVSGAYHDYAVPGTSLTLRFHAGRYSSTGTWSYFTPSFGFSMQIGTRITDGTVIWEIVEAGSCIAANGVGMFRADNLFLYGGGAGVKLAESEGASLGSGTYSGYVFAGVWGTNGDAFSGESGGFTNQNSIDGYSLFTSSGRGWGLVWDGGFDFNVVGACNFQSCPEGWLYGAGLGGLSLHGGYHETTGGKIRNTNRQSRVGVGTSGNLAIFGGFYGTTGLDGYEARLNAYGISQDATAQIFTGTFKNSETDATVYLTSEFADSRGFITGTIAYDNRPQQHSKFLQAGSTTLVAGVSPVISVNLRSTSRVVVTQKTPGNTALTVEYAALGADRVTGTPGSIKITALVAAGTINTADTSTVDWMVFY